MEPPIWECQAEWAGYLVSISAITLNQGRLLPLPATFWWSVVPRRSGRSPISWDKDQHGIDRSGYAHVVTTGSTNKVAEMARAVWPIVSASISRRAGIGGLQFGAEVLAMPTILRTPAALASAFSSRSKLTNALIELSLTSV